MTAQPVQGPPSPWYGLAAEAYRAAWRRDHETAATAVQAIADQYGPDAILGAMQAWVDSTLHYCGIDQYGTPLQLNFHDLGTGHQTGNSNETHPLAAWSGRVINARAAMDLDLWVNLMDSAQTDPQTWTRHVMTLLMTCALTARGNAARKTGDGR
jgi:hypothetical protein